MLLLKAMCSSHNKCGVRIYYDGSFMYVYVCGKTCANCCHIRVYLSLVLLLECLLVASIEGSITLVDLLDLKQLTGIGH